jgi:hypothetical protein
MAIVQAFLIWTILIVLAVGASALAGVWRRHPES